MSEFGIDGEVIEVGLIGATGTLGVVIDADGRAITITGLTQDQVRFFAQFLYTTVELSVKEKQ